MPLTRGATCKKPLSTKREEGEHLLSLFCVSTGSLLFYLPFDDTTKVSVAARVSCGSAATVAKTPVAA